MKHVYKLKNGSDAVVHAFRFDDWSGADVIEDHNKKILTDVFQRVRYGLSEYAYMSKGNEKRGLLYVISRDPVYGGSGGAVRVSVFVRFGCGAAASFEASSHKTYGVLNGFLRDNPLPSGRLFLVGGWYDDLLKKAV